MAIEVKTAADVRVVKEAYGLTYDEFARLTGMSSDGLQSLAIGRRNLSFLSRIRIQQIAEELAANPPVKTAKNRMPRVRRL